MKALITGASSGIGRDIAELLAKQGVELILVARRGDRLEALKETLRVPVTIIAADLSQRENCLALCERCAKEHIDILINNAGFGDYGMFYETDQDEDERMIDTNIKAVMILTKYFLKQFVLRDHGYIVNVASTAAFSSGPLMANYYATKSYVFRLSTAIAKELEKAGSHVHISVLCPGPTKTEFQDTAKISHAVKAMSSKKVAQAAIAGMWKGKLLIFPSLRDQATYVACKVLPDVLITNICYHIQSRKRLK